MSRIAIQAESLGKLYRIGGRQQGYRRLTESLASAATAPWRRLRGNGRPRAETFWALREISFQVGQGEVVGVIGRNGAGKSTLLKILSRITEPSQGRVRVRGRVGSLLEVGTGFHPELTGRENIFLNGTILGMRKAEIERAFDEIVSFAEVERFLDTPVKHYSSGMYLRLAFAVAAHLEPEILLVDEVLAVGDAQFQRKCLGKMGEVAHGGRTVLFVSHNMQAVRQLCRRGLWLGEGRLLADDRADAVVDRYLQDLPRSESLEEASRQIAGLPPDPLFRLESIVVCQDGKPGTDVESGKPVEVEVEYSVAEETAGLHVYFQLCDRDGTLLFESIHNGDAEGVPTVAPGRYRSRATIPADFLAPIGYELRFLAGIHNVRSCLPEPVCLPLTVQAAGRVNRAYPGYHTPGRLAPWISWSTQALDGPGAAHETRERTQP